MSLVKCDVTGSTDRVQPLPEYMQTDKIKNVCFKVAIKMEKERINPTSKKEEKPIIEKKVVKAVKPKKATKKKSTNKETK